MNSRIERLPVVVIFPYTRCNCRCTMCDIWQRTDTGMIEVDRFARYAHDFAELQVEWVVFSGGEPLMHPHLDDLCAIAKTHSLQTTILTTGLLLERHAGWIASTVDDVIVSLDGPAEVHDRVRGVPGAFAALERGVRALRAARPGYPVTARCTVQKANCHSLTAATAAARALGLDAISFLAADSSSAAFDHAPQEAEALRGRISPAAADIDALAAEIEELIAAGCAGNFVRETPDKLRRIVQHFRAGLGQCEAVAPRCNAPWVSAVLETDGTVRPCFFHPPVGVIEEQSLKSVLNAPAAEAFRAGLQMESNPICQRCVCSLYIAM